MLTVCANLKDDHQLLQSSSPASQDAQRLIPALGYAPYWYGLLAAAVLPAKSCFAAFLEATAVSAACQEGPWRMGCGAARPSQILLPQCAPEEQVRISGKCLWFVDTGCSSRDLGLSHAVSDAVHASPRAGLTTCGAVQTHRQPVQ